MSTFKQTFSANYVDNKINDVKCLNIKTWMFYETITKILNLHLTVINVINPPCHKRTEFVTRDCRTYGFLSHGISEYNPGNKFLQTWSRAKHLNGLCEIPTWSSIRSNQCGNSNKHNTQCYNKTDFDCCNKYLNIAFWENVPDSKAFTRSWNPVSPIQHKNDANNVEVIPFPVSPRKTATFLEHPISGFLGNTINHILPVPRQNHCSNAINHVIPHPNTSHEICLHQDKKYRSNIHKCFHFLKSTIESFSLSSFGDAVFDVLQHASSEIMDNLTSYLVFKTIIDIEMKKDDTIGASNCTGSQIKISLNIGKNKVWTSNGVWPQFNMLPYHLQLYPTMITVVACLICIWQRQV